MADQEYDVGYGKPPVQHRFQKGRSGNPKGRSKETRNFMTILLEELATTVAINGTWRRISKGEAIAKRLVNNAVNGDPRAMSQFIKLMQSFKADTYESPEEMSRIMIEAARHLDCSEAGLTWAEYEEAMERRGMKAAAQQAGNPVSAVKQEENSELELSRKPK